MIGQDSEWIAYHTNSYVLGVNTRLVKSEQAPRSYEALLDGKWKDGKISLDSDAYPVLIGLSQAWGKEKAVHYLKRLAGQNPVVKRGNDEQVQLRPRPERIPWSWPMLPGSPGWRKKARRWSGWRSIRSWCR